MRNANYWKLGFGLKLSAASKWADNMEARPVSYVRDDHGYSQYNTCEGTLL